MISGLSMTNIEFRQGDFFLKTDLELENGRMACLLGPSGSGKTTILRLIGGFETPCSGKIRVMDREITGLHPEERKLGIVFQDYALFPHMTVYENITYGIKASGLYRNTGRKERKEIYENRVRELLELVHLPGYKDRKIGSLSGGEQQRTALARALAPEPDLLLLDEPLSALDVQLRTTLRREIKRIQETLNLTTLYITHDQEEAMAIADRIFIMNGGKVVESGEPEKLYSSPKKLFTGTFLGVSSVISGSFTEGSPSVFRHGEQKIKINPAAVYPEKGDNRKDRSLLFFRPGECIPGNGTDSIKGTVAETEYRGEYRFVILDTADAQVKLHLPPETDLQRGDEFSFHLEDGRGIIFPDKN